MNQGLNSFFKKTNRRAYKTINPVNAYNEFVPHYEECKILKYVSKLGPEFPQNVLCEGYLRLSYDYIDGITVKQYISNYIDNNVKIPIQIQKNILYQIINIYTKLFDVGFYHGDPGLDNFIINNDIVYIIDFGFAYSPYRKPISVYEEPIYDEFDECDYQTYDEPLDEYKDIIIKKDYQQFLIKIRECLDDWADAELIEQDLYDLLSECNDINQILLILV